MIDYTPSVTPEARRYTFQESSELLVVVDAAVDGTDGRIFTRREQALDGSGPGCDAMVLQLGDVRVYLANGRLLVTREDLRSVEFYK
jgi:hypothetical protein